MALVAFWVDSVVDSSACPLYRVQTSIAVMGSRLRTALLNSSSPASARLSIRPCKPLICTNAWEAAVDAASCISWCLLHSLMFAS
ncbi:hypothetical protein CKJ73_24365 [Mycobacterium avium]|nr:hypothetical protein CKJ73_24365 [Mycobacterium avium]